MRTRKEALGSRNIIGARVTEARKRLNDMTQRDLLAQLQVKGIEMNASGLSKLEGQHRYVMDFELAALADVLHVKVDWLLGRSNCIKGK
ncbi:XRE family transcriptional regulator [Clostridium sp. D33t1_170424_F3]|uniref:helix-turn-helix domain-containing protein n=1 Tax=Clostridium sp. D33t1_170424_F3 TaxID=2787099 RepID=UPI0018A9C678|nr:XRE family transcriptional regulator [Clostridium sp. D33t1_170424_F3]